MARKQVLPFSLGVSAILPASLKKRTLEEFQQRSVSMDSRISTASSVNDFIDLKVEKVEAHIASFTSLKQELFVSFRAKEITEKQYEDGLGELQKELGQLDKEESVLKRQRKLLEEDIEDEMPLYSDLDEAYRGILITKVAAASSKQPKREHKFDKSRFRRQVKRFYGSEREILDGEDPVEESFCVLFGWLPLGSSSAAHLVPKSLDSGELQYLFGVNDTSMLSDPRVAIPLHKSLETALDKGQIVIVPIDATKTTAELRWKCVVTDSKLLPKTLSTNTKWRDIHMRTLHWANTNRPAKRYLYFRFLMTYLMCKTKGKSTDWVDQIAAKGKMWCTPGPYLRRSMVQLLAKECGDKFLPEVFYEEQTFEDQALGGDKEKGMAREMRDKMVLSSSKYDSEDDSSESWDEDSDSESE